MPSGLVTVASAGPEPSATKDSALVRSLPGRRMIWEVALALRCFLLVDVRKGKRVDARLRSRLLGQCLAKLRCWGLKSVSFLPEGGEDVFTVMRLVHESEDDLARALVLGCDGRPKGCKDCVAWSALADGSAV